MMMLLKCSQEHSWLFSIFFFFLGSFTLLFCSDLRLTLMAGWNRMCFIFLLMEFWRVKWTCYSEF